MSWLLSLLTALLSGLLSLLLAGFIANACVSWYHISSREGQSGYFVVLVAIAGGVAGVLLSLLISFVFYFSFTLHFGRELLTAFGTILIIAGVATYLCRSLADIPPEIDGSQLSLEVEFRFPNTCDPASPPTQSGDWEFVFSSFSGRSLRKQVYGTIVTDLARFQDEHWIVPTQVELFTQRGKRGVRLSLRDATEVMSFQLPLPAHPDHRFESWSDWLPRQQADGSPWPADKMACRFRVQKIPSQNPGDSP